MLFAITPEGLGQIFGKLVKVEHFHLAEYRIFQSLSGKEALRCEI